MDVEFGIKGVHAKAGDLAVSIFASEANKFASGEDKARYTHLNVDFDGGIPVGSKGIFAELAGVQPMSEATTALLKQPKVMAL